MDLTSYIASMSVSMAQANVAPVSYTHLDVYKRQRWYSAFTV